MSPRTQTLLAYIVGIVLVLGLIWVAAGPAEAHRPCDRSATPNFAACHLFFAAEDAALIEGDPFYYPLTSTWDEVRHAFVVMTQTCQGWEIVDYFHDIGEPSYYCDGLAEVWEFQWAWDWLADHWKPRLVYGPPWRTLIEAYFPSERVEEAMAVMWCESRGDPDAKNPRSTASGLWQYLRGTWVREAATSGLPTDPINRFDPVLSTRLTADVVARNGGWRQWSCRRVLS